MHDVTLESVAAVTDHFADAFVRENVARVYMTLWRRNDVRKFDADAILTGPRSAVGNVSGNRCESDCRSRGREFDPGPVPYFRGD